MHFLIWETLSFNLMYVSACYPVGTTISKTSSLFTALLQHYIGRKRVHEKLSKKQRKQKYFYDKKSRDLSQLKSGDTIRVQRENKWEPGVVTDHADTPRSYHVRTERGEYRRNRKHLMKTNEIPIRSDDNLEDDYETNEDDSTQSDAREPSTSDAKPYVTRYGRTVKRLRDSKITSVNRYCAVISIFGLLTFKMYS